MRIKKPVVVQDEVLPEGKFSILEYAKENFRMGMEKYEMQRTPGGSVRGTVKKVMTTKKVGCILVRGHR